MKHLLVWEKVNNKYFSRYNKLFNIIVSFTTEKTKIGELNYIKIIGDIGVYPNYTHKFQRLIYNKTLENLPTFCDSKEDLFKFEAETMVINFYHKLQRKLN
jgi:hypothetical protein